MEPGRVPRTAASWQNGAMSGRSLNLRQWFPSSQPQTLQLAVALLYWNAALSLVFGLLAHSLPQRLGLILLLGDLAGGAGIAKEKKLGYYVAVGTALLTLALSISSFSVISILFAVALVVLLLHPMSRSYYKLWYR